MALVSLRQVLDHAAINIYGVPAFNVNNLEQMRAIMMAADETNSPVIVLASAGARQPGSPRFERNKQFCKRCAGFALGSVLPASFQKRRAAFAAGSRRHFPADATFAQLARARTRLGPVRHDANPVCCGCIHSIGGHSNCRLVSSSGR